MKELILIGGPNGSGKTTFAEATLFDDNSILFVNSDNIAKGIAPKDIDRVAVAAGKVMIQAVDDALSAQKSIAFEATLSGKSWLKYLERAKAQGYLVSVYFVFVTPLEETIRRIELRVAQGGHAVPPDTVRRRYARCFRNFWNFYRPLADEWHVVNNSEETPQWIQKEDALDKVFGAFV